MRRLVLVQLVLSVVVPGSELHEAVRSCEVPTLTGLLGRGASPNETGEGGETPLHVAARHGKPKCMYLLLAAGSNKYPWNNRRQTAELIARKYPDNAAREQMLALLESPGVPVGERLDEALDRATLHGRLELTRLFLSMDADPNVLGPEGNTPLHNACLKGLAPMVELLLDRGAQVGVLSRDGTMPIHDAAVAGHAPIVALLLHRGARPEDRTEKGETPLHLAAAWNRIETVRLLLAAGARADVRDARQRTPLAVARDNGNSEVVDLLVSVTQVRQ